MTYSRRVTRSIDEPTSQFLEAAAADLQRQLGVAGDVETISIEPTEQGIGLRARVRVGKRTMDVEGQGGSIVEAYSELHQQLAVPTLITAFRELIEG